MSKLQQKKNTLKSFTNQQRKSRHSSAKKKKNIHSVKKKAGSSSNKVTVGDLNTQLNTQADTQIRMYNVENIIQCSFGKVSLGFVEKETSKEVETETSKYVAFSVCLPIQEPQRSVSISGFLYKEVIEPLGLMTNKKSFLSSKYSSIQINLFKQNVMSILFVLIHIEIQINRMFTYDSYDINNDRSVFVAFATQLIVLIRRMIGATKYFITKIRPIMHPLADTNQSLLEHNLKIWYSAKASRDYLRDIVIYTNNVYNDYTKTNKSSNPDPDPDPPTPYYEGYTVESIIAKIMNQWAICHQLFTRVESYNIHRKIDSLKMPSHVESDNQHKIDLLKTSSRVDGSAEDMKLNIHANKLNISFHTHDNDSKSSV